MVLGIGIGIIIAGIETTLDLGQVMSRWKRTGLGFSCFLDGSSALHDKIGWIPYCYVPVMLTLKYLQTWKNESKFKATKWEMLSLGWNPNLINA